MKSSCECGAKRACSGVWRSIWAIKSIQRAAQESILRLEGTIMEIEGVSDWLMVVEFQEIPRSTSMNDKRVSNILVERADTLGCRVPHQ